MKFRAYYYKTCDVHEMKEKFKSIDTNQELHVLKVWHHNTGSTVCELSFYTKATTYDVYYI